MSSEEFSTDLYEKLKSMGYSDPEISTTARVAKMSLDSMVGSGLDLRMVAAVAFAMLTAVEDKMQCGDGSVAR